MTEYQLRRLSSIALALFILLAAGLLLGIGPVLGMLVGVGTGAWIVHGLRARP